MQSNPVSIPLPRERVPDWLLPLRNAFLALLVSLGLNLSTVKNYAPAVDWFCAKVRRRGLMTPDGVDEAILVQIRTPLPAGLSFHSWQRWAYVIDRFIVWLVKDGIIAAAPQPPEPVPTALETLCTDYGTWLCIHRGLAPRTIKTRQGELRNFLTFRFGDEAPGDLSDITRADIVAYLGVPDRTGLVGCCATPWTLPAGRRGVGAPARPAGGVPQRRVAGSSGSGAVVPSGWLHVRGFRGQRFGGPGPAEDASLMIDGGGRQVPARKRAKRQSAS